MQIYESKINIFFSFASSQKKKIQQSKTVSEML